MEVLTEDVSPKWVVIIVGGNAQRLVLEQPENHDSLNYFIFIIYYINPQNNHANSGCGKNPTEFPPIARVVANPVKAMGNVFFSVIFNSH